jgi:alcohol dehydrogenase class IV
MEQNGMSWIKTAGRFLEMLTQYNLKMPHAVYGGENAMDNITAIIKARGAKKVAMFTDKGIEGAGLFALPENAVKAAGAEYYVLDDLPPEPSYMTVQKLVDQFKASGADLIVACGGGSVMDAAKLASVLVTDDYGVKELLDNPGMAQKCVPIVLIPTTAGTGAEVTPNAIVAVPEKELKVGIVNENMIADYVILDARMIKNLPRKIAAATGVDALAHCIECFTSNKANPFSDLYALEGLDLILNNIEKACDDPEAMTEKNRMQIAAYYGGLAITASGTTAVHALSYPLGGKYHIAHGVSNAILLAPVMRFNSEHPAVRERLAIAYDRCCHEEKTCTTVEEKTAWMIARLEHIVKHLDIPTSLKEFGVPAEDLEGLVEAGMQVQRLLVNNMRPVTADDARKLYQEVM